MKLCVLFITRLLRLVGRLGTVQRYNHNSWITVVTPTDNSKSVHNRCVIEVLVAFLCCQFVFEFSVGIWGFVTGLCQISFFSLKINLWNSHFILWISNCNFWKSKLFFNYNVFQTLFFDIPKHSSELKNYSLKFKHYFLSSKRYYLTAKIVL